MLHLPVMSVFISESVVIMMITMVDVTTDIIIIILYSLSLGGDKTTKLEHYVTRGYHSLIHFNYLMN